MLDDKQKLLAYIEKTLVPDDDDKLLLGSVFTSIPFVEHMLDLLITTNPNIFSFEQYKWFDCSNGIGNFPICIYYRLMEGLSNIIKDVEERKRHILENMIYTCEINKKNNDIYKKIFQADKYKLNIYEGDFFELDPEEYFGVKQFDITIGNPPYQKPGKGGKMGGSSPLYNLFIERSLEISRATLFVTPSRWFSSGKGLESFRKSMLESDIILFIEHYKNSKDVFKHVSISGGVSVIMLEHGYSLKKCKFICNNKETWIDLKLFDVIAEPDYIPLVERFIKCPSLEDIAKTRNLYCIETNGMKTDKKTKEKYETFLDEPTDTTVVCHTSQKFDFIKYIEEDDISVDLDKLKYWKVITGKTGNKKNFGRTLVCKPTEVYSNSYLSFTVENEKEAESLISYMKTKLARVMLGLRKNTQDISPEKCRWVPIVPFDREWTDEKVEEYFNLSDSLKELIEKYCEEYDIKKFTIGEVSQLNRDTGASKPEDDSGGKPKRKSRKKEESNDDSISFDSVTAIDENGEETELTIDDLSKYTITRLKEIAKLNDISLRGAKVKADIVRRITDVSKIKI